MKTEAELYQVMRGRLRKRIVDLFKYPGMWAYTREGYISQLAMALDLLGIEGRKLYDIWAVGSAIPDMDKTLDSDFIERTKTRFEDLIAEKIRELKNEKA